MVAKIPTSPYPGLRPFTEAEARYFFGRKREQKIISANLRTRRLTLLYGPSGVGKSSVLNAGVISPLRPHDSLLGRSPGTRPSAREYHKPVIAVVATEWRDNPVSSLHSAIIKDAGKILPYDEVNKAREYPLPKMIAEITRIGAGAELLVILDQFEEYFVYHSEDEITRTFDDEFSRALIDQDLRVNFLISIREDWLSRLDRFKGRIPNLFENTLRIEHLKPDAARDAIEKPVDKYNEDIAERGAAHQRAVITKGFVDEALAQLEDIEEDDFLEKPRHAGAKSNEQRIQSSRLQIVLEDLWERVKGNSPPRLDVDLLPKPDSAKKIIELHLNKSLARLKPKEKEIAASFFPFLTTTQGTKFADSAEGLAIRANRSAKKIEPVLKRLSEHDLSILDEVAPTPAQGNQHRYELTSDALTTHILNWSRRIRAQRRRWKIIRTYVASFVVLIVISFIISALFRARQRHQAAIAQTQAVEVERAKAQRALNAMRTLDQAVPYSKAVLRGHGERVTSAVFTPDGRVLTASKDGSAILWDIDSMNPIHEFNKNEPKKNQLVSAAVSPKGGMMVTASTDNTVTLWDLNTGKVIKQLPKRVTPPRQHVTGISFSRSGDLIAAANTLGDVTVWNSGTGDVVREVPGNGKAISQIAFSPNDTFLAAASYDFTVHVWRTATWREDAILLGHTKEVNGLAISADEKYIATASADTTIRVWESSSGKEYRLLQGHAQSVNSVDFDKNDGNKLLSASDDTTARVWNVETSKSIELIGHTDKVLSASFSPNGQQVVTASKDHVVRIWSARNGTSLVELNGHLDEVTYVVYSADGKYILTASDDATARVWKATDSGVFAINQPKISASPGNYSGPCPVTITFGADITANSGSGIVRYRFQGSGAKDGPIRKLPFDEPDTKHVNWYRRVTATSRSGSETIEVLEPKDVQAKTIRFAVVCTRNSSASPTPSPESPAPAAQVSSPAAPK